MPCIEVIPLKRPPVFMAYVFNAAQIDGLAPFEKPEYTWDPIQEAERIVRASQADIAHDSLSDPYYDLLTDSIHLPGRERFPLASNYYATLLHELGHWTGHRSRLNRDLKNLYGSPGYAREELRAEIASLIIGSEIGIGYDPSQHAAYVANWITVFEEDPLEIFRAAQMLRRSRSTFAHSNSGNLSLKAFLSLTRSKNTSGEWTVQSRAKYWKNKILL